jgi:Flp pilus assembly pilin Flp
MTKVLAYFQSHLVALREREEGQALVEYGLILALVSVAAIITLTAIGVSVDDVLSAVETALDDATP